MKDTENRPQPRKRRKWGSVIVRRDADGNPTSFQARYVNPLDPPKKVGRNFGLEYETEAYRWLDEERYLVTLHNKGIRQWVHPSQRGANTMPTFREYSKDYFDKYRKPDGSKLSGRSNRCNGIVLRRLNETFGDTPLDRITRQMVDDMPVWTVGLRQDHTLVILASPETERGPGPRAIFADPSGISRRRRLEGNGRPAMVHHRSPAPASSELRVPCSAPGGLRPIIPKRARPTRPPPRGGAARLPHVRRKENRNAGRTLKERTMRMESMELQHAVFETEEKGRVDAMWSDVRLHAGDIPDGWHCYAVRGGDGGWPPCSIEKTVWVNHAGDIITPDDLDPLLERNDWMLVIRDWWFTDEPFKRAE